MKNFFWTLILLAVLMNLSADRVKRWMDSGTKWRVEYACEQVQQAKRTYYDSISDNENALESYNQGTAEERKLILTDRGLLTDKTCLYVTDPGAMDEPPSGHSNDEMVDVARQARSSLGSVLLALNRAH